MTPQLEILRCSSCSAPVALADAATVRCTSCGADVVVPQSHRDAFAKMRRDSEARGEANALYARLGEPPRLLRVIGVVFDPSGATKRLTGSRHVLLRGVGWYYKWVLMLLAPWVFLAVAAVAILLVVRLIGAYHHANVIETLSASTRDWIELPVPIAAALAGTGLGVYGRRKAISRHRLQAALAARPPSHDGGPSSCRACGAPLSVAGDALGVRCVYCGADNLVALPREWLAQLGATTAAVSDEITVAGAELARQQKRLRRSAWLHVGAVAGALAIFMGISLAAGTDDPVLDHVEPSWPSFVGDPRPLVRRDVTVHPPAHAGGRPWRTLSDDVATIRFDRCPVSVAVPAADCDGGTCTLRLYAALRHGETAALTVDPPAHVRVEDHTGFPWPRSPDARFGDVVADVTAGKLTFEVEWSSWHELAVIVPATTRSLSLCFAVHHP
ncbi:MAG: hypothetical protein ACM31C_03645 [Acidobacteriota bacterium]